MKKNKGTLMVCIDYMELNKFSINKQYHLHQKDDSFDQLQGVVAFLKTDLRSSYH